MDFASLVEGDLSKNQLHELRSWAINSGHPISGEYVDYESGRKGAENRPAGVDSTIKNPIG